MRTFHYGSHKAGPNPESSSWLAWSRSELLHPALHPPIAFEAALNGELDGVNKRRVTHMAAPLGVCISEDSETMYCDTLQTTLNRTFVRSWWCSVQRLVHRLYLIYLSE